MPLCESCMFGTSRRRQWVKKWSKLGSTRKDTNSKPGSAVSLDQLRSAQLGLSIQLSGKLTSMRILFKKVMVHHFSDLTYVHLIRITSQEENLSGKTF